MAIGAGTNLDELEKVTTNRKNIIESPSSEESKVLGKKIMKTIVKGNTHSRLVIKIGYFEFYIFTIHLSEICCSSLLYFTYFTLTTVSVCFRLFLSSISGHC